MTETNNANLDFANEVCKGRVTSSTKKNYTSMYSHFISWISKNHENLLTADSKDVNLNASLFWINYQNLLLQYH
jgi:hypothetical protein